MSSSGLPGLPGRQGVDRDAFRTLMSGFPSGVAVVTSGSEGSPAGMTCSSVCSVSLDPPVLLVCLRAASPTLATVVERGSFAVNFLSARARPVAELFASGDPDRFSRVRWAVGVGSGGPHLVGDADSVADCSVHSTHQVGDHVVVLGDVLAVHCEPERRPLLYGLRRYEAWPVLAGPT
ncbi:oxidase [Actinoalloteichus sp. AHMU CJ021]|nr:oxidase [Actinoalloteichus sp. AHMU CJ021]